MNIVKQNRLIFYILIFSSFLWIYGCSDPGTVKKGEVLIQVEDQVMTSLDFAKALEFSNTAYPHNAIQDKGLLKTIRLRLMDQLIEEMILVQKAKELNIVVSEPEIQQAVDEIKKDYPDDEFRETFLENAVSYETWKNRLKIRILMEKVIRSDLEDKIKVTKEDISGYYKDQDPDGTLSLDAEAAAGEPEMNEMIMKNIRRKKAEENYKEWIKNLRKEYKIEINKKLWEKILES
jgi:parvulin-like peptidyl-prolyl isomerase